MVEGGGGEGFSCCHVSFCSNSNCNCYDCLAEEEGNVKREGGRKRERGEACSAWAAQIFNLYFVFMLILHFPQFSHPQKAPLLFPASCTLLSCRHCEAFSASALPPLSPRSLCNFLLRHGHCLVALVRLLCLVGYLPHEASREGEGQKDTQ